MILSDRDKARFWAKVNIRSDNECWPWLGSLCDGYGLFRLNTRLEKAHRVALELHLQRTLVEDSLHTCDNRACCNKNHLYEGSAQKNAWDREDRQRRKQSYKRESRISDELKAEIRQLKSTGLTNKEIASRCFISTTSVSHILTGRCKK